MVVLPLGISESIISSGNSTELTNDELEELFHGAKLSRLNGIVVTPVARASLCEHARLRLTTKPWLRVLGARVTAVCSEAAGPRFISSRRGGSRRFPCSS